MQKETKQPLQAYQGWRYLIWLAIFWFLFMFFFRMGDGRDPIEISYTHFKEQLVQGNIDEVTVQGDRMTGTFEQAVVVGEGERARTTQHFSTAIPSFGDPELVHLLEQHQVSIRAEPERSPWLTLILVNLLPWVLILGLFIYLGRRMQERMGGTGSGLFGFGRSKAKRYEKTESEVRFADIAGLVNAKQDMQEIIHYLRDPSRFRELGSELPKGVLLMGPPGTGKTLLARATAGEAEVPFFSISGSEFVEMFVGVGASRVRDMFQNAKAEGRAIIFIDEIDSIGRTRGAGLGGGHDEREQTLNQILSEMDGFAPHESVVVMAATNRPDVLDPALVRPGRFDRQITLDLPQRQARQHILQLHTRKVPLAEDVDLERIAAGTIGFSGADLKNLVNEAALLAGRHEKPRVDAEDFDQARDKILLGSARDEPMTEATRTVTAYHEAGHTLMARLLPGTDPLQKVSIIPRGRALGATEQLPEEERYHFSRSYLLDRIAVMLGGRVAEKVTFHDITSGAADDLKQATQLARRMVCQWGMSDKLGPVTFRQGEEHVFLGRELAEQRDFSEHTARLIDEEVRLIVRGMEEKAEKILTQNRDKLKILAQALLEHETLNAEDVDRLLGLEPPTRERGPTEPEDFVMAQDHVG